MGGVLAVLAVLVVVAVVVINSGLFTATDIQIQGSEHVTKHDAIQLIDLPEGTSLFNVDPDQITEDLKQNPCGCRAWMSSVSSRIRSSLPAQIGDASDKSDKRPMLTRALIDENQKITKIKLVKFGFIKNRICIQ